MTSHIFALTYLTMNLPKNDLDIDVQSSTFNPCGTINLIMNAHWASLSLKQMQFNETSVHKLFSLPRNSSRNASKFYLAPTN